MNDPGGRDNSDDWTSTDWRWQSDEEDESLFFWGRPFLPPPPRPSFLEESLVLEDGQSTCDLCSWALGTPPRDPLIQVGHGLPWTITLVIVSIISAVIGAVVMVTLLHCKRRVASDPGSHRSSKRNFFCLGRRRRPTRDRGVTTARLNNAHKTLNNLGAHKATNVDVESRSSSSNNLCFVFTPCAKAVTSSHELSHMTSLKKNSNHYTVEEGGYQHPVYGEGGEPVYTELDKISHTTSTPAYQNTGYLQCDIEHTEHNSARFLPFSLESTEHNSSSRFLPCDMEHTEHNSVRYLPCDIEHTSSAPSSAYYSDFSEGNTRQYECIGDPPVPQAPVRNATKTPLSVIAESLHNVPSEYI